MSIYLHLNTNYLGNNAQLLPFRVNCHSKYAPSPSFIHEGRIAFVFIRFVKQSPILHYHLVQSASQLFRLVASFVFCALVTTIVPIYVFYSFGLILSLIYRFSLRPLLLVLVLLNTFTQPDVLYNFCYIYDTDQRETPRKCLSLGNCFGFIRAVDAILGTPALDTRSISVTVTVFTLISRIGVCEWFIATMHRCK